MGLTKREAHLEVLERLSQIYVQKNEMYGDSTTDTFKKFGLLSYAVRLNDKLRRFQSIVTKSPDDSALHNESVIDTLLDMANYAVLAVIDIEAEKQGAARNAARKIFEEGY